MINNWVYNDIQILFLYFKFSYFEKLISFDYDTCLKFL